MGARHGRDRKSTRLNSSHTEIYTLSLHDALPISAVGTRPSAASKASPPRPSRMIRASSSCTDGRSAWPRSEEHTSELQSHRDLHSFPTRRSSDLGRGDETVRRLEGFPAEALADDPRLVLLHGWALGMA